jgi:hypothetical protein
MEQLKLLQQEKDKRLINDVSDDDDPQKTTHSLDTAF